MGSQSCEKSFRAARNMTSTFSTIINFGMLGLLRRLHRLQIQVNLQAEANVTGIIFPRADKHRSKDGQSSYIKHSLEEVTDESILEAVRIAQLNAKASIEKLGMFTLLDKSKVFDSFCCPEVDDTEECLDEDDEDDEDPNEYETDTIIETQIKEVCTDDPSEVIVKMLSSFLIMVLLIQL